MWSFFISKGEELSRGFAVYVAWVHDPHYEA
jgi:hypothetical protein